MVVLRPHSFRTMLKNKVQGYEGRKNRGERNKNKQRMTLEPMIIHGLVQLKVSKFATRNLAWQRFYIVYHTIIHERHLAHLVPLRCLDNNFQPYGIFFFDLVTFCNLSQSKVITTKGYKLKKVKTDSAQSSSNNCKNYLLRIYSQYINFFNTI